MTFLIVVIGQERSKTAPFCCRSSDYARRQARLEEHEFYDQHGGLGQRVLYRIISGAL